MNATIRNEYPYPIAKAYMRTINAEEPVERFTQIGYLFEVTLKYLAAVSVSEYLTYGANDDNVNKTLSGIKRPSLGHWVGFLRDTLRYNLNRKQTILSDTYFKKSQDYKQMAAAINTINEFLTSEASNITSVSQEMFVNTFVNFRNKTKGHGAIQKRDCMALNQILFDGVEQFILSIDIFKDYELAYIRKIEFDKRRNYLYSLERLDGTDTVKTTYTAPQPDPNVRVGHICVCKSEDGSIRPFLSLHPLFIFLDDKEDVYVLNESEAARIEYLCYHRGGRDAIYTPDELKEDFFERFGKILQAKDLGVEVEKEPGLKKPEVKEILPEVEERKPEVKKKPPEEEKTVTEVVSEVPRKSPVALYAIAAILLVVIGISIWYFVLRKQPTDQSKIEVAPSAPTLVSPANGATDVSPSPSLILTWNRSSGATSYQLQVSTDPTFSSSVLNRSGITDASYAVAGLANNMKYYWRVNATNVTGMSEWSSVWDFTTKVEEPKKKEESVEISTTYFEEADVDIKPQVVGGSGKVYSYIDYSNLKMESGFQGTVTVIAYVNERGRVDKTEIVSGIDARFNNASMNAVEQLQFTPAKRGGKTVKSKTKLQIEFKGK